MLETLLYMIPGALILIVALILRWIFPGRPPALPPYVDPASTWTTADSARDLDRMMAREEAMRHHDVPDGPNVGSLHDNASSSDSGSDSGSSGGDSGGSNP